MILILVCRYTGMHVRRHSRLPPSAIHVLTHAFSILLFEYIDCHNTNRAQPGHCTGSRHHHRTSQLAAHSHGRSILCKCSLQGVRGQAGTVSAHSGAHARRPHTMVRSEMAFGQRLESTEMKPFLARDGNRVTIVVWTARAEIVLRDGILFA